MNHPSSIDDFDAAVRGMGDVHLAALQVNIGVVIASFLMGRKRDPRHLSEHGSGGFPADGLSRVFQLEPFLQPLLAVTVYGVVEGEL